MTTYTLKTTYWDEPSIVDKYDNADEAYDAYMDTIDAARYAPKHQVGDIRSVTLLRGQDIIRKHSFGATGV